MIVLAFAILATFAAAALAAVALVARHAQDILRAVIAEQASANESDKEQLGAAITRQHVLIRDQAAHFAEERRNLYELFVAKHAGDYVQIKKATAPPPAPTGRPSFKDEDDYLRFIADDMRKMGVDPAILAPGTPEGL